MATFYKYEDRAAPPSLSEEGRLYGGTNSELISCLESCLSINAVTPDVQGMPLVPKVDIIVRDGTAVVNMLPFNCHATFEDYAINMVVFYATQYLDKCERVDVVWDNYQEDSLTSQEQLTVVKACAEMWHHLHEFHRNGHSFCIMMITKQNYFSYTATVPVIPPVGPDVIYDSSVIQDVTVNNQGLADYN